MGFFDMFDKLDDIIYKPVEAICDWVKEPLKKMEYERSKGYRKQEAQIEEDNLKLDAQLKMDYGEHEARLQFQRQQWDIEINRIIAEQEDARRDKLVEAIKKYQIQLADASRDIVNSIGIMTLELRSRANDLIIEKTQAYKKVQDEAKKQSMQELKEAKDNFFESDPQTYRMLVDTIMEERQSMVETAGKCIIELSEDLKRLNDNTDILMKQGMEAVDRYLQPVAHISVSRTLLPQTSLADEEKIVEIDDQGRYEKIY